MEHLESQECSINHLELHNRVRQWLEESPDIRPKQEDLLTSKHWSISRHSISVASYTHLEDWEDESLFEALHYPNGSSGVLSCFRGMFRKSKWNWQKLLNLSELKINWANTFILCELKMNWDNTRKLITNISIQESEVILEWAVYMQYLWPRDTV